MREVTERTLVFIEDDTALLNEMTAYFAEKHNAVHAASTLADARRLLAALRGVDAVVLDIVLPDGSGFDILREEEHLPPVVILSDLGAEESIYTGLQTGAADYIVKPCSMRLLETRIALRLLPKKQAGITLCGITMDSNARTARYMGSTLSLTASEFNVLYFLMAHAGQYFTAQQIYEQVWGAPSMQTTTIKRHLSTLRQKLKSVAPEKTLIITAFGKGYSFPAEGTL